MEVSDLDFLNKISPKPQTESATEAITRLIDEDKVVPIIGNGLINDLMIGSHKGLVDAWGKHVDYPHQMRGHSLARMTQFAAISQTQEGLSDVTRIKRQYIDFMKEVLRLKANNDDTVSSETRGEVMGESQRLSVSKIAKRFNYPNLTNARVNPLLLLAELPLSIFVTTSYHESLASALREKKKDVQIEVFHWQDGLPATPSVFNRQSNYEPTPDRPLVYHLNGLDKHAESLVLLEDDYLDFLTNLSRVGREIHVKVREALTTSSLILMGYQPREWDFRTVFSGIIKPRPNSILKDNVYIQVAESDQHQAAYLEKYMRDAFFEVAWQDPADFIMQLYQGWQNR